MQEVTSSPWVARTGWQAMLSLDGLPGHDLIHVHMYWMFAATGLALATGVLAWRLADRPATSTTRWALACGLAATCGVLMLGADRGALLVFRYGIGTQQETPPAANEHGGPAGKPVERGGGGHEGHR